MTLVLATIGAKALYLLYGWLISAAIASWLSARKGYGERPHQQVISRPQLTPR